MNELQTWRDEARNRADDLAMVSAIAREVNSPHSDASVIFQEVVDSIRERLGFHPVIIFAIDSRNGQAVNVASSLPDLDNLAMRIKPGQGLLGAAIETQLTVISNDVLHDPRYRGRVGIAAYDGETGATRAELVIPLMFEGELIGLLNAQSTEISGFQERDRLVLEALANEVAAAIQKTRRAAMQREQAWVSTAQYQVARTINDHRSLDSLVATMVRLVPLLMGAERCGLLLWDYKADVYRPQALYSHDQAEINRFLAQTYTADDWPVLAAVHVGKIPRSVTDTPPWGDNPQSYTLMPLEVTPHWVGVFFVGHTPGSLGFFYPFQHEQRWRLQENIAFQLAQAIDREQLRLIGQAEAAERWQLQHEIEVALDIQTSLIPDGRPAVPALDVASYWQAARQVSGDFYDFLALPDGRWGIIIADVAGKGIPAALFMALSRTILRAVAFSRQSPDDVLGRANEIIFNDTRSDMFVTVFYALWQPADNTLTWANGGHNPPILVRDGNAAPLLGNGLALGVIDSASYQIQTTTLQPGDIVLFYTDGVTEATNGDDQLFGMTRLCALLAPLKVSNAQQVIDTVAAAIDHFTDGRPLADDVTMVALVKKIKEE